MLRAPPLNTPRIASLSTQSRRRRAMMRSWIKAAMILGVTLACGIARAEVKMQGAGATFPAPIYQRWVAEYQKAHPDVKIDYQAIGSGGGIKAITEKTVDF